MSYTQPNSVCENCGCKGFTTATQAINYSMLCNECYRMWQQERDKLWSILYPKIKMVEK
jgi:hypothetical protein